MVRCVADVGSSGQFLEFEDIETWPVEVVGSEVLSSLADLINRHMYIKTEQADATAFVVLICLPFFSHKEGEKFITSTGHLRISK